MKNKNKLKSEVFKEYGIYSGDDFLSNSIGSLGFDKPLTSGDIDFIREGSDSVFKKETGLDSDIEFTRDFFCNFKQYKTHRGLFFRNGRNFFDEFKDFYKRKFRIEEDDFIYWERLRDKIDETVGCYSGIVPVTQIVGSYIPSILKEIFDYIDCWPEEFPFKMYFDHNNHSFILCCNITKAENGLTSIKFEWRNWLKKYFEVPENEIRYNYDHSYSDDYENNTFYTNSDVIQFMLPLKLLFPYHSREIQIIFNGKEYTYYFESKEKWRDPTGYYTFRFCKTFYLMTGTTPYEWAKKEITDIREQCYENYEKSPEETSEDEDEYGLKIKLDFLERALPELEIQHRKILVKNEFSDGEKKVRN